MKNNIVLCGFMGCGKTTVGKLLAKQLNFEFVDSDLYIEQKENKTISDIFAENGELCFRKAERDAIKELSEKSGIVLATGGGAVIDPQNAEALRSSGLVVFLDVTPETVIERLKDDTSRLLLQRPDRDQAVRELMDTRYPVYKASSDISVEANGDAAKVVEKIMSYFKKNM